MMTDDKKLEVYYDHYKDTFQQQVRYLDNRNRYFLIALVLIALLFFLITDPNTVNNGAGSFIGKYLEIKVALEAAYISNFLLFGLLWVLILYFQTVLLIEKQYKYLVILEEELSKLLEPLSISREGKSYLKVKPTFSKLISKIYKLYFPLSIAISVFIKLIIEIVYEQHVNKLSFLVDLILCSVIIAMTLFYTFWQNWERKQK